MSIDKILFLLSHRIWIRIKKYFINLSDMDIDKKFVLPVIH
jgi:hypothetical protein